MKNIRKWRKSPNIYEINTWVWLNELSQRNGYPLTLGEVPEKEWDILCSQGFDAVWLMGVWERSPKGIESARHQDNLLENFKNTLSDFQMGDIVGSPYCIRRYQVDPHLGGREGLAHARRSLLDRNVNLVLDFVPNHVAPDHPWVTDCPEFFLHGTTDAWQANPDHFYHVNDKIIAHGRDPYFPPWPDVLQLNVFENRLREAVIDTLMDIASQCDGVRCDMAMLVINAVFANTWKELIREQPTEEYWIQAINSVKSKHPDFLFIAEAYWNMEHILHQQGFDCCYDKILYDLLEHSNAQVINSHLHADISNQEKLVRFIENHDEPRANLSFSGAKNFAAAVAALTLPGARLIHEGQITGNKIRLPVFLQRRPPETADLQIAAFYQTLLEEIAKPIYHDGNWKLCAAEGWPDNTSCMNILAWCWEMGRADRCLIIINYAESFSQARILLPWHDFFEGEIYFNDLLNDKIYERKGNEIACHGLYIELPPWGQHFFRLQYPPESSKTMSRPTV